ncbi:hypothetical protein [uncultured Zhongshania sp.]|uniref:hypothetical protein n=1 Tax=uncultured Zhongshania sp. TaxID=1642288 RepID=UPI0030DCD1C8
MTLKCASTQLGMPHIKLLNQLKKDGYVRTSQHGPVPDYERCATAEMFTRSPTFHPVETANGIINKQGFTVGVTPHGFAFIERQYKHLKQEQHA